MIFWQVNSKDFTTCRLHVLIYSLLKIKFSLEVWGYVCIYTDMPIYTSFSDYYIFL